MADAFNIRHHPTISHSSTANVTIERLNRYIIASLRAILGELKRAPQDSRCVIGIISPLLNEGT